MGFISQTAYGEMLYGDNGKSTIFVDFEDDLSKIVYESTHGTSEYNDSVIKQFKHGGFFLKNPEFGMPEIVIFGHPQVNDKYTLVVVTSLGFEEFTASPLMDISTAPEIEDIEPEDNISKRDNILEGYWESRANTVVRDADKERVPEKIIIKQYTPELKITSSVNPKTYRGDTFNMDVQAFDGKINPNPKNYNFDGRLDDVDITVLLLLGDELVTTLKGITSNNGHWNGEHYFSLVSSSGEYTVDILASYGNQTVSKSMAMFVSSSYSPSFSGSSSNNAPVANAGPDQTIDDVISSPPEEPVNILHTITLDGSRSSDPDKTSFTFSWSQISGSNVTLSSNTAEQPTFTSPNITQNDMADGNNILTFKLTVKDPSKATNTDIVTITIIDSKLILN